MPKTKAMLGGRPVLLNVTVVQGPTIAFFLGAVIVTIGRPESTAVPGLLLVELLLVGLDAPAGSEPP